MPERLTDRIVKELPAPKRGNKITYDENVKGFGVRMTAAGAQAFVLNYRAGGVERRITIGSFPDWSVQAAREEAKGLKRRIDVGEDPMGKRHDDRAAPTVDVLANRFEAEHLVKKRSATQADYKSILRLYIRPELGRMKVADLRHVDIDRLHARIARTAPYRANRTVSVLSKMLQLAIKWEMRTDNPARGIERVEEQKRDRFLTPAEIERLAGVLSNYRERVTANAIKLLLLTGARRGETLSARWSEFDLKAGVWTKPSAHTKTKKEHRVPLSAPAIMLLSGMHADAERERKRGGQVEYVFQGAEGKPLQEPKRAWASICRQAGLTGVRLHDLRHSYASILASAGLSLPIIGRLLGHTQAATTQRYAHLLDDPLRAATERAGEIISRGEIRFTEIAEIKKALAE